MSVLVGNLIKNQLNFEEQAVANLRKREPNDSISLSPAMKYIRNLSVNPEENNLSTHLSKIYYSPNISLNNPKAKKINKTHINVKRLTLNNLTNISNLNVFFVFNSGKDNSVEKSEIDVNLKEIKSKEPEDNIQRAKIDMIIKKLRPSDTRKQRNTMYSDKFKKEKIIIKQPLNNLQKSYTFGKKNLKKINNYLMDKEKYSDNSGLHNIHPKGTLNLSEFTQISQIGKGTFGKIYAVKWKKNGKKYAMKKEIFNDLDYIKKRKNVIKIMDDFLLKTNNKGLIHIYSYFYEKKNNKYNYYELMEIGELDWEKEIIARRNYNLYYKEEELLNIASQLIKTLSLMQRNHITHRDIKPQNILVVNGNYKLCDFGEIRIMKRKGIVVQRIRGSELYMSPILFYGLRNNLMQVKHNTYKSDVFSLGMCLLYAATMHFNSTDEIREMTDMNQIKNTLNNYLNDKYSKKFISLINVMLQIEEQLRPDFIQLEEKMDNSIKYY